MSVTIVLRGVLRVLFWKAKHGRFQQPRKSLTGSPVILMQKKLFWHFLNVKKKPGLRVVFIIKSRLI